MGLQQTLKAISDPNRREILNILKRGRMTVSDISNHFKEFTFAAVSKNLNILKDADLIRDEREGKFIYYELNTSVFEDVLCWVSTFKGDDKND